MTLRNVIFFLVLSLAAPVWAGTVKVACIGDSITAGAGSSGGMTYPFQLQALLGSGYQVTNYGVSGCTMLGPGFGDSPYIVQNNFKLSSTDQPNIVIIKLGTNDSKSQNWANKAYFESDTRAMVAHYAGLASKPQVYLVLPCPVYNAGAFGITNPIVHDEVIPILRTVAGSTSTPLIDVNTAMSGHPEYFPDNVHPNNAGYAVLAQTVFNAITLVTPSNATATAVAPTQTTVSWTDGATNETGYSIERKVPGGTFAVVGTTAANMVSFSDTTVVPVTDYIYRVRAVNASGQSPFSNEAAVSTPDTVPLVPFNATAVAASTTRVDLTWAENASNEIGFKIERRTGSDGAFSTIGTALADVRTFSDTGLAPATMYTYRVRATNSAGDSDPSNEATVTTFSGGVLPTADDSDGDGFTDALETAAGTSPLNATDTPMGGALAGTPKLLADTKMSIKLNFAKSGRDGVAFSCVFLLAAPPVLDQEKVVVDVGGVARVFTLNNKGSATTAGGTLALKGAVTLASSAKLSVKLAKGDFVAQFADEGLANANVSGTVAVRVSILFDGELFENTKSLKYTAKAGKSGSAK